VIAADLAFCRTILPEVSRTFSISIAALPEGLGEAVLAAYLLCRIVDSIEDDPTLEPAERDALFDAFQRLLVEDGADPTVFEQLAIEAGLQRRAPEGELSRRAGAVLGLFRSLRHEDQEIVRPQVLVMLEGMRSYCRRMHREGRLRIADGADLEQYCYYVAGTVGELLTGLFIHACPSLTGAARATVSEQAVSFGVGLQLVNIVKDVAEDFERGAIYLPEDLARKHGVQLEDLLDPSKRELGLAVLREVCARARHHLDHAVTYVLCWPSAEGEAIRLFCAVPLALAQATLTLVESGDDTLSPGKNPKVSRDVVARIVQEARQAAGDDARLSRLIAPAQARRAGK
jgi:farnesyl-diphosphate farnesyltransferase